MTILGLSKLNKKELMLVAETLFVQADSINNQLAQVDWYLTRMKKKGKQKANK